MKQIYILFMVAFLPLFAQAGLLNRAQQFGINYPKSPNRDFRLDHYISSDKEEGLWIPSTKHVFNYSDIYPSRVESVHVHGWYENDWGDTEFYYYFEYNAAGLVTSSIIEAVMGTEIIPYMRTENTFDAQNRITRWELFLIDFMDFETWISKGWYNFEYGANNQLEIFSWGGSGDGYDQYSHSTFSYDSSGRITEELIYTSMDSENWSLEGKNVSTYHPQDNSTGADFIAYISGIYGAILLPTTLDMPILVASDTDYLWIDGNWVPEYRTMWEYDNSLRRIREDDDDWETDQWVTQRKNFFHYDANGNLSSNIEQEGYGGAWEDYSKIEYFWDSYTSSDDLVQEVIPAIEIKAWPMPFSESLNISTSAKSQGTPKISIYNSRGQMIREYIGSDQINWDGKDSQGRDSANGIYFIRATQDNASATTKVIRVK